MTEATRLLLVAFTVVVLTGCERSAQAEDLEITVYKSPTCGCCNGWIDHLQTAGFLVSAHDVPDMGQVKRERGVPSELGSCHTAEVAGYVVEGHVPAADIHRLVREKPAISGLAGPGMPIGSPGMEGPNPERYEVLQWSEGGETSVYAVHGPGR